MKMISTPWLSKLSKSMNKMMTKGSLSKQRCKVKMKVQIKMMKTIKTKVKTKMSTSISTISTLRRKLSLCNIYRKSTRRTLILCQCQWNNTNNFLPILKAFLTKIKKEKVKNRPNTDRSRLTTKALTQVRSSLRIMRVP